MSKTFRIQEYKIYSEKIKEKTGSVRLVYISDLHNVDLGGYNRTVFEAVKKLSPDGVMLGGDMITGRCDSDIEPAVRLINQLSSCYPTLFSYGNHENKLLQGGTKERKLYQQFQDKLDKKNLYMLDNEKKNIQLKDTAFCVYGLNLEAEYYKRLHKMELKKSTMHSLIGKPDPDCFSVLLAHTPRYAKSYYAWGADLTLCGHYHGGLIRLFRRWGVISPYLEVFPRYCYGKLIKSGRHMIVGAGLGEHGVGFRFFNPREIVVLDIVGTKA